MSRQDETRHPTGASRHRLPRWARWGLEALVAIAAVFAVQWWLAPDLPEGAIPAMAVQDLDGNRLTIGGESDRPTVVAIWATWCGYCKLEMPWLVNLAKDHRVITVALQSGDARTVGEYLVENDLESLTVVNDPEGRIAATLGTNVTPTFLFLDHEGNVAHTTTGLTSPWGVRLRLWWMNLRDDGA